MRIAYMLTSLGIGGAERQVIALAERMQARGHEVVLLVLRQKQAREWPVRVDTRHLDMTKSPRAFAVGLAMGRHILRDFRPGIVHSHTFPANMAARMLRLGGAAPKVVSTIHNVYEGGWGRTLAYRLTGPLSIHTTAVSQAVADRYCRIGAVQRGKCSVITNGIDAEEFRPKLSCSGSRDFSPPARDFVWAAIGRDVAAKDFDNLLAAFRLVRSAIPECELRIAGEISERRRKEIAASGFSSANGIRWIGVCENTASILEQADAFVLSSAWEGMPLAAGEAMAMEKPVVAVDVGGVRELVGATGWLVPAKDPGALADAMLQVMRLSEAQRAAMGRSGRERICQYFDINAKTDAWEALYARLLG